MKNIRVLASVLLLICVSTVAFAGNGNHTYQINITPKPSGAGKVYADNNKNETSSSYKDNFSNTQRSNSSTVEIYLHAKANTNYYQFYGWSTDGVAGNIVSNDNPYFTTLYGTKNETVTYNYYAHFRRTTSINFAQGTPSTEENHYTQVPTVTPSEASDLVRYSISNNSCGATIDEVTGRVSYTKKGSVTVTATIMNNHDYVPSSKSYTLTVTKIPTFVTFDGQEENAYETDYNPYDKWFRSKQAELTPVGNSWNNIVYSIATDYENSCGATISSQGGALQYTKPGKVKVIATYAGDGTYGRSSASYILTVKKMPVSFQFQDHEVSVGKDQRQYTQPINSIDPWDANVNNIRYSISNNTCGATINATTAQVSFSQAGSVRVTATYPENEYYLGYTDSYVLTVTGEKTVDVSPASATIKVDETQIITVESKKTDAEITYDLGDNPTVSVTNTSRYDQDGKRYLELTVKGVTPGLTTIDFQQDVLKVTSEITVIKKDPVLEIQATPNVIYSGETSELSIKTNTGDGTSISYSANNSAVTISGATITANDVDADTQVTITGTLAATEKCNAATATTTITVKSATDPALMATLTHSNIVIDENTSLTVQSYSDGAVTYTVADESIVEVIGTGKEVTVRALAAGTTTINISQARSGHYKLANTSVTITVEKKTATASVSPSEATVKVEKTIDLTLTTISDGEVRFWSENDNLATVTYSGKVATVTAVAEGEVKIYYEVAESDTYLAIPSGYVTITVTESNIFQFGRFIRLKGHETGKYAMSEAVGGSGANKDYMQHTTNAADVRTIIYAEPTSKTTEISGTTYSMGRLLFYDKGQYTAATCQMVDLNHNHDYNNAYAIIASEEQEDYYTLISDDASGKGKYLYDGDASVDRYAQANGNRTLWLVEVVEALPVTILAEQYSGGYATLYCPVALQIPDGVNAYNIAGKAGEGEGAECDYTLVLERLSGVIPANTPAVVYGTPGTYNFPLLYSNHDATPTFASGLKGALPTLLTANEAAQGSVYTLQHNSQNGNTGFYLWAGANTNTGNGIADNRTYIHGFRAYFVEPAGGSAAPGFRFVREDDPQNNGTGINNVNDNASENVFYDLQGRKVQNPQAGQLYIVNGHKVLVK